jgi:hypothetical protein
MLHMVEEDSLLLSSSPKCLCKCYASWKKTDSHDQVLQQVRHVSNAPKVAGRAGAKNAPKLKKTAFGVGGSRRSYFQVLKIVYVNVTCWKKTASHYQIPQNVCVNVTHGSRRS